MMDALNIGLAVLVLVLAIWTVVARDTFAAVVGFVAYGMLLALVWVQLAGIDVILKLRTQIDQMQKEMNEFVSWVREEMKQGAREGFAERLEQALVRLPPQGIVRIEPTLPIEPAQPPAVRD